MKLLFTGGHHNSALVVIDWLLNVENTRLSKNPDIFWVGKKHIGANKDLTPEYKEIKSRNIPFYNITAGKLFRTTSFMYIHLIIFNLIKIPIGFIQSMAILLRVRPDLIVSFGGYMALPVVLSGRILGIRSVTHEQTAVVGLANKIVVKYVENVYTTWPVKSYPNYNSKYVQVGLPIRSKILSSEDKSKFKFSNRKPVIYVSGGKLGSEFINNMVLESLPSLFDIANIIWSTGVGEKLNKVTNNIDAKYYGKGVIIKDYFDEDDISKVFNTADVFVTRGGAHTLYEIALAKKSSVIIPIPWSSNNEQLRNAKQIEGIGLGLVLDQNILTPEKLINAIKDRIDYLGSDEYDNIDISKIGVINNADERLGNEILKKVQKE